MAFGEGHLTPAPTGGTYDRSKGKGQLNPAVSYNFGLQVEAMFFVPIKSVRVFTKENEFDYYQEGGLNDYVHMLRKPISKPFTFQVEKYVGTDSGMFDANSGFIDPLALGTDLMLPLILFVNRAQTTNAGDNFSFDNCARAYIFTGCTVISKEYGELNAEQSKLLTETTTISYRELFAINQFNPAAERGGVWKMDASNYLGGGESHKGNRAKNSYTKKEGESTGKSNLWILDKDHPTGGGSYHGKASKNDTKKQGEEKGKGNKWTYDGSYAGKGKSHDENRSKNKSKTELEEQGNLNKWGYDGSYAGKGKSHDDNRSKNKSKTELEEQGTLNKWIYDGTVDGKGKSHPSNRNKNEKPTPVKWPPTRRALKAQALSEL